jgi:hypothetical protein
MCYVHLPQAGSGLPSRLKQIKADYNLVTKHRDNARVMYVMNALRRLQNVLRPYKVTLDFNDLVGDAKNRAGHVLEKMKVRQEREKERERESVCVCVRGL